VREKLSFTKKDIVKSTKYFSIHKKAKYSGIVLSTCNRVEIYFSIPKSIEEDRMFSEFIGYVKKINVSEINDYIYKYSSNDLIAHLYKVASGLDSMVLGENQILGQVKDAYYQAKSYGMTDSALNCLFESALKTGKKVRTETDIGKFPISISSIAVRQIESIYHDLNNRTVMVIGAGKMSDLTCANLFKKGATSIIVSSRTYENAKKIAREYNGQAVPFDALEEYLIKVDIVISQTASPHIVLSYEKMKAIMDKRDYRNILIVDIAVPRDVEEKCRDIKNLSLYNIDDLKIISNKNRTRREKEVKKCEKIIKEKVQGFEKTLKQSEMNDVLRVINEYKTYLKESEIKGIEDKFKSHENLKKISSIFNRTINKILHPFLKSLRESEQDYEKMLKILIEEFGKLKTDTNTNNKEKIKNKKSIRLSKLEKVHE